MAEMDIFHLEQAVLLCFVVFVLYATSLAIYRLYLHPLAGIPGPKLAALTRYYEAYFDVCKGGVYTFKISKLHKEYGMLPLHRTCVEINKNYNIKSEPSARSNHPYKPI